MRRSTPSRSHPRRWRARWCWPSSFCSSGVNGRVTARSSSCPELIPAGLIGGPTAPRQMYLVVGPPTVGLCLVLLAVIAARAVLRRQDVTTLLLACAITIVLTCWVHD